MASLARTAVVLSLFTVAAVSAAHAGPPFISVELPANPLDRTTRGAYLLVHGFHHEQAVDMPIVGTAEGLVDGKRRSIPLTFEATSRPGVFAVRRSWGTTGSWLLVMRTGPDEWPATALVGIGADGEVRSVRVPTHQDKGNTIPSRVSPAEVDRALQQVAAAEGPRPIELGLLGGVAILPLALLAWRRRHVRAQA